MFRLRSNWITIDVEPCTLLAVMVVIDGIVENCLISGVATDFDIVSGEAPGSCAETVTTGKSTLGSAATGRKRYAKRPAPVNAIASRMVATGRRMKGAEMFITRCR